jgi:UDP-4-amino-4,6-dideoxy-N-acetyl-beta-L-altrosamine transaminase
MKTIPYGRQSIDTKDLEAVIKVLQSEFLTQGPKIEEFEQKLARYCNAKYAVVVNSGTAALHAAYFALGLTKGDEFITSPITFAATTNAGLYLGAKPVFTDIDPQTGNIDTDKIEDRINPRTKLITPIHFAGHPVDLERVHSVARKHNLYIVEDACHALGAEYKGEKIGSCKFSDMAVLSFHPVKHITTGEGGAVLTNNKKWYEKMLQFRTHGITKTAFQNKPDGDWYYEMQLLGYNYRLTDLQAALGISQLEKIDRFVTKRREIAKYYNKAFEGNEYFDTPPEEAYAKSAYHLYSIRLKDKWIPKKREIFSALRDKGLGVQVHYIPVYLQPYYQKLGYKNGVCPIAEDFYKREISIPMYPVMDKGDIGKVINLLLAV